jgi:hypothetical protein
MDTVLVPAIDEEMRRQRVAGILVRLQRYTRGFLRDLRIESDEDFLSCPARVTIKVWWRNEEEHNLRERD